MNPFDVETKLFQNRYVVDAGRAHIRIRSPEVCEHQCEFQPCVICCPAGCFRREGRQVSLLTDGCLECGSCRIVCNIFRNLDWNYPRGGYGIQYKFG